MARLKGIDFTAAVVAMWLTEADKVSGGRTDAEAIASLSHMVIQHMRHRSIGSIVMMIRDGIGYADEEGKVYGTLTWPKISLWITRHEQAILNMSMDSHSNKVTKNDNVGKDWMDKLEKRSQPVQDRKDRIIDSLKRKLRARDDGNA